MWWSNKIIYFDATSVIFKSSTTWNVNNEKFSKPFLLYFFFHPTERD